VRVFYSSSYFSFSIFFSEKFKVENSIFAFPCRRRTSNVNVKFEMILQMRYEREWLRNWWWWWFSCLWTNGIKNNYWSSGWRRLSEVFVKIFVSYLIVFVSFDFKYLVLVTQSVHNIGNYWWIIHDDWLMRFFFVWF
jgi:hypothetical protein